MSKEDILNFIDTYYPSFYESTEQHGGKMIMIISGEEEIKGNSTEEVIEAFLKTKKNAD